MKLYGACIVTHNIEKMVGFYTKLFGYGPTIDGPDHRFPAHQLIVFKLNDTDAPSTKNAALIYQADDVDLEFARLSALELASAPPTNKPWGVRSFGINDPDGNSIAFFTDLK